MGSETNIQNVPEHIRHYNLLGYKCWKNSFLKLENKNIVTVYVGWIWMSKQGIE